MVCVLRRHYVTGVSAWLASGADMGFRDVGRGNTPANVRLDSVGMLVSYWLTPVDLEGSGTEVGGRLSGVQKKVKAGLSGPSSLEHMNRNKHCLIASSWYQYEYCNT